MPKATVTLPDGTLVTIEGDPEEISRILSLYSRSEEAKVWRAAGGDKARRRASLVWWLGPLILGMVILVWLGIRSLDRKLDTMLKGVESLDRTVTQTARIEPGPSVLRSTSVPRVDCSRTKSCTYQDMTMCFLQVGAESDWRLANTASMKETAEKYGAELIFSDSQNKQEYQIAGMRTCIQQGVSVIALAPIVTDGWDEVLMEARSAGIPVIIVDRGINADPALYATHIGSSMILEGERAAAEFNKHFTNGGSILEIAGAVGSRAAIGRAQGFRDHLNSNIKIIDSQTANFTRAEAFPVMQTLLQRYKAGTDFQGIYFHNDDMGIGGIEALKQASVKPCDLFIISIDATRGGFQAMVDGWFQADVECNPLLGPQVFELALKLMNGEPVEREVLTLESVYYPDNAAELISHSQY